MASDSSHYIANPYEPSKPFACITLGSVTKLLPTNYLNWHLQVEAFLYGFDLLKYPDGSFPAPSATITTTATPPVTTTNPAYQTWRRQDRIIYGADYGLASVPVCRRVIIHTLLSRMSSYPQGHRLGY
ncbi:hypothetical protein QL285_092499 [Trifolium repens]|nr:hypothetical protein QL285_092499 [Trifolium repens]